MRRVTARWSWGVAFLVIGGAVVGFLGYRRSLANRPPIAAVTPATQRIVAAPHSNRITAQFRIRNAGGRELVLGEASTTCGCTVASIQPKVLKAGEQGLVTVQGTSPNVGENTVSISVATNAESGKPVEFRLTMVGSSEVPFVSRSSGPVRLGFIRRGQEPEKVWIEAVEKPGETPWIRTASGTFPGLDVEGGVVKEGPYPGGAILRTYEYRARLSRLPEPGEVRGEVAFRGAGTDPILTLPVSGTVRPPAYASPAALFANCLPEDGPPKFSLMLFGDDPKIPFEAEVEDGLPEGIEARRTSMGDGRVAFEIACREVPKATIATTLHFKTNDPTAARVSVPLTLRVPTH